jgi:type I restriction enzyme, S subunit
MLAATKSPFLERTKPAAIKLQDLLLEQPRNGWSPPAIYQTGQGIPVLTLSSVTGCVYNGSKVKLTSAPTKEGAHYWLQRGELLITRSNTPELVGHAAIYDGTPAKAICCDLIMKMKVNPEKADIRFVHYCLRSPAVRQFIAKRARGGSGTMQKIGKHDVQEIPIPQIPLTEQRRLVARIESLTTRAQELAEHTQAIASDMQRAVASFYERLAAEAPQQSLEAVASPVRRPITTTPEGSYPELGLRSFGKGTFHKPALSGTEVGGKRIFRIHAGDLVFSNVFGWEGAIAVAQPEDDGRAGSHRYITYLADPAQSTPEFLCFHFLTARGLEDIRAASPGSAGRNRTLGLERLKQIQVPVPPIEEQRRFTELVKRQREITKHAATITEDLRRFEAALLAKAFRGEL